MLKLSCWDAGRLGDTSKPAKKRPQSFKVVLGV
jgi:hypothetical protein